MTEVPVRKGEPVDRALKRLKSKLDTEGLMEEVRRLRSFETPIQKYRRKARSNAKRGKLKIRFVPPAEFRRHPLPAAPVAGSALETANA
jgi:small subunit ribosomal protein S21